MVELDREECVALLRSDEVGRVGLIVDGSPVILPVNYRLVDSEAGPLIALRTRPGNVIDLTHGEVAFEIDGVDHAHRRGWSVLVRGPFRHREAEVAADSRDSLPWIERGRDSWLVIEPLVITGRRLESATIEWAFLASGYL